MKEDKMIHFRLHMRSVLYGGNLKLSEVVFPGRLVATFKNFEKK